MTPLDVILIGLLVALSLGVMGISLWAVYLFWGRATQSARYDLDAAAQALKMQSIIDQRVSERVIHAKLDSTGKLIVDAMSSNGHSKGLPEQPPAPNAATNVRTRSIIDDVHESEREANRIIGDLDGGSKRDYFKQPLPPMEP